VYKEEDKSSLVAHKKACTAPITYMSLILAPTIERQMDRSFFVMQGLPIHGCITSWYLSVNFLCFVAMIMYVKRCLSV
jgi:hypothetical protein